MSTASIAFVGKSVLFHRLTGQRQRGDQLSKHGFVTDPRAAR